MKKNILSIILCIILCLCTITPLTALAYADQDESYINSNTSFYGNQRRYDYKNIGYKYSDSSCDTSGAYFNVYVRRWATDDSWFYSTRGTCKNNPAIVPANKSYGYLFNDANKELSGWYAFYIEIKQNNNKYIKTKSFIKYSVS